LLPRLRGVGQTRPGRFRTRLRVREGLVAGRSPRLRPSHASAANARRLRVPNRVCSSPYRRVCPVFLTRPRAVGRPTRWGRTT
jgi:hypothetical protein